MLKTILLAITAFLLYGCATHAKIDIPELKPVYNDRLESQKVFFDIYYRQPEPGFFTGDKLPPISPINQAKMSVSALRVLGGMPKYLESQLPNGALVGRVNDFDYKIRVELTAKNKGGPAYADYEFTKTFFAKLATFSFGPSEYDLIADFSIKYELFDDDRLLFSKEYSAYEALDHEVGNHDDMSIITQYTKELFEKHILITLHSFLNEYKTKN